MGCGGEGGTGNSGRTIPELISAPLLCVFEETTENPFKIVFSFALSLQDIFLLFEFCHRR